MEFGVPISVPLRTRSIVCGPGSRNTGSSSGSIGTEVSAPGKWTSFL